MKKDFIPRRDSDLHSFETNFLEKLSKNASELKLKPSATQDSAKIIEANRKAYTDMNLLKASYHSAYEKYIETREKAVSEIRRLSTFIKKSKSYTRAFGDEFRIIYPGKVSLNTEELKPLLKLKSDNGKVIIKYLKRGTDGISIYSKRENENTFTHLANSSKTTFIDDREKIDLSKPEVRKYYAVYLKNYQEIGMVSDIVRIVIS